MKNKIVKNAKEMTSIVKSKFNAKRLAASTFVMTAMYPSMAYADGDLTAITEKVISWMFTIVAVMGVFKLIQGIIDLVNAQDSNDGEKRDQGARKLAVGVALVALKGASMIFAGYVASYLQFS